MDPLQWMGAVRMRVQTADKNISLTTWLQPINSDLVKWKNCLFESSIHNIAFSSEKKLKSSRQNQVVKYAQIKKEKQHKTVLNKYVGGFWF